MEIIRDGRDERLTLDGLGYSLVDISGLGAAWQVPGPAALDFSTDACTVSRPVMLKTIIETGINDRWTANGASEFEADMAKLTGREATIFMISSIMGNQVAIRSHLGIPPYSLLCDTRSHLDPTEAGGVGIWSGVWTITVTPSNGLWLTLEDIQRHSVVFNEADSCTCPIKLIYLEVPLGGIVMPLPELRRICTWAHTHDIKIHMDGARLWEAVISGVGTLHEYCALPDSINLCLTKGLGGAVGSILVGDKEYLEQAQRVREAVGGSIRQPGFVAAAASAAVKYTWGKAIDGADSLLKPCHTRAAQLAGVWTNRGGRLACPQQTNMIWIDLDHAGIEEEEWEAEGRKRGLHLHSSRIIVHFQISEEGIRTLEEFMIAMLEGIAKGREPLHRRIPRDDAVSRLASAMQEAWERRSENQSDHK